MNHFVALLFFVGLSSPLYAIDVDEFFATHFVVDGLTSYYVANHPSDKDADPFPGRGRDPDFSGIKTASGINAAPMSTSTYRSLLSQVSRIENGRFKNARVIRRFSDLRQCRDDGAYGILFYKQSPWPMTKGLASIEQFKDSGLRIFQLAYGASKPPPAGQELGYGCDQEGGLTDLGRAAIQELNRLHMIVDVSHCNEQTTIEACQVSKQPVIATHANVSAVTKRNRNKSDAELLAIARSGGVIGITTIGSMIQNPKTKQRGVDEFVDHIDYLRKLVGVAHVGISSDAWFNGWPEQSTHFACADLASPERWKHVARELIARGYTEPDLTKIFSHNWLRVFRNVLDP